MRQLLVVFFLVLFYFGGLVGCGPSYRTDYNFVPPESQTGQTCILQCENNKLQCMQLAQMRYATCQQQSDFNYQMCETRKQYRYDRKGRSECIQNCYCSRTSCSEDTESCEVSYRTCYQSCGGTVTSHTYCVSNCDKIAP